MPEQNAAIQLNLAWSRRKSSAEITNYFAVADSNHYRWGLPEGRAKPDWSHNAADSYPVEIVSGPGTRDSDADRELVKSREFIEVATQIWLEAM